MTSGTLTGLQPTQPTQPSQPARPTARQRLTRPGSGPLVLLVAVLAGIARLPFLTRPLGPDEGGLLLLASQWAPGRSLYGNDWVDRPPLLIDLFSFASHSGGLIPLRLLGIGLVVVAVLLAARVGHLVGGPGARGRPAVVAAATAAIFLSTPMFGVSEVNGELIATPFLLAGVVAALSAARATRPAHRLTWAGLAGAAAAAAILIKQNEVDVVVLIAIGTFTYLRRPGTKAAWPLLVSAALGALALTGIVLSDALRRGTSPLALWDALVTFRIQAGAVIQQAAPAANDGRFSHLIIALALSAAPLVLMQCLWRIRRRPSSGVLDLRVAIVGVLVWESFSVVAGGSYWLHYLICFVPGLVLAASTVAASGLPIRWSRPRLPNPALGLALTTCLAALAFSVATPPTPDPVIVWLKAHTTPGQTAIVAFGHPDYLEATGLTSPYSQLWSLPVRVRDPQLTDFTHVIAGSSQPTWIVTGSTGSIEGWGMDATVAQRVFEQHYRLVAQFPDHRIYVDRTAPGVAP